MKIEMKGINKSFGQNQVLKDAGFVLDDGEVHALMGENGAGKSTLMKILTGVYTRDRGTVIVDGKEVTYKSPQEAERAGIVFIQQELNVLFDLTVEENLFLGKEIKKGFGICDRKAMRAKAEETLKRLGVSIPTDKVMSELSVGQQQMIEIARNLIADDLKILIMDEPTSSLSQQEVKILFKIMRELLAQGISIVYISHRLDEIFRICDRAIVMRDGKLVGSSDVRTSTPDDVIMMMSGKVLSQPMGGGRTRRDKAKSIPLLELEHITDGGFIQDLNLTVYQGEVLGIGGLVGSKRTELARMVCGADPLKGGVIKVSGKARRITNTRQAIDAGLGYLSENRKEDGLSLGLKIEENTIHCDMTAVSRRGFMNWKRVREVSDNYIKMLKTKGTSATQVVNLSGGNQQKVAIAKWLHAGCNLLIFDEPTRGIDVAAKAEIHQLIRNFAAQEGKAAIVISSEVNELVSVSDRIIVMSKGQITGELEAEEIEQNNVLRHITTKGR